MTIYDRMGDALDRIATASSITRNRTAEAERQARRGNEARQRQLLMIVERFEALADEMEQAIIP